MCPNGTMTHQNPLPAAAGPNTTKNEQCLWQDQYLKCAEELAQWETIDEFSRSTENMVVFMESAWKRADWATIKDTVIPRTVVSLTMPVHLVKGGQAGSSQGVGPCVLQLASGHGQQARGSVPSCACVSPSEEGSSLTTCHPPLRAA